MTQQEMQAMQAELQARFPGLEVVIVHKMLPDHTTQTFVEHNWIAIFYDNICVSTIKSQQQLDAFINVARIMSQGQLRTGPNEQELAILKDVFPEKFSIDNR